MPLIIFHGDSDSIVAVANAEHLLTANSFRMAGMPVKKADRETTGVRIDVRRRPPAHQDRARATQTAGSSSRSGSCTAAAMPGSAATAGGRYTDPQGPDASAEMVRFFLGAPGRAYRRRSDAE